MPLKNLVMLRDSTMLECMVKTDVFTIKTSFATIPLKRAQIAYMEFKSPQYGGKDMVQMSDRTTFVGKLTPDRIEVDFNGTTLTVPTSDIRFVVLFVGPIGKVSATTKKRIVSALGS